MIIRPKYLEITEGKMSVTPTFVPVTNLFWMNIQTSGGSSNSQTGGSGANLWIRGLNLLLGKAFATGRMKIKEIGSGYLPFDLPMQTSKGDEIK